MKLKEGDRLSKDTKTWTVRNVSDGIVELDSGEFVPLNRIELDVRHDRTQVFKR